MEAIRTDLIGVYLIQPKVFGDNRGWFMETWSKADMEKLGLYYSFIQDNQSYSAKKGTLRGLHFQKGAASQAKLVRCIKGAVLDAAVDLRKGSPTYMKWITVELSAENKRQLLIPRGFAHGFLTLTDHVEFLYKEDNPYNPESERNILWNDLGIDWGIDSPILSGKDANAPKFNDSDVDFVYRP